MAEISNTVLAVLVIAALVVVVAGTVLNLKGGVTGFATSDTGNVTLTINSTLAIQVDTTNKTINFGICSPRAGSSYWCASNDSIRCTNSNNDLGNCTGDTTTPQFIRVDNVGNVDANVTFQSACTAAQLIGGTSPAFQYITTNCNGTNVTSWSTVTGAAAQTGCANVSYRGGAMRFYVNVTIPQDAAPTGCTNNASTITFSAVTAP
jgi:hypothetical protein